MAVLIDLKPTVHQAVECSHCKKLTKEDETHLVISVINAKWRPASRLHASEKHRMEQRTVTGTNQAFCDAACLSVWLQKNLEPSRQ